MKKDIKLTAVLLIILMLAVSVTSGCGRKADDDGGDAAEQKTLADYIDGDEDAKEDIIDAFSGSDIDGSFDFKGNEIIMKADVTSLIGEGKNIDKAQKAAIKKSMDSTFDSQADGMKETLSQIRDAYQIAEARFTIEVLYDGKLIYSRSFSDK